MYSWDIEDYHCRADRLCRCEAGHVCVPEIERRKGQGEPRRGTCVHAMAAPEQGLGGQGSKVREGCDWKWTPHSLNHAGYFELELQCDTCTSGTQPRCKLRFMRLVSIFGWL